jgi:hypothetical protein
MATEQSGNECNWNWREACDEWPNNGEQCDRIAVLDSKVNRGADCAWPLQENHKRRARANEAGTDEGVPDKTPKKLRCDNTE